MKVTTLFAICLIVILMSFSIAQSVEIGSENKETGVNIVLPELPVFNNNTAFVNSSGNWVTNSLGTLDDVNTTQFDNVGGTLTIDPQYIQNTTFWRRESNNLSTRNVGDIIFTTGLGQFGMLQVDNININGNVISNNGDPRTVFFNNNISVSGFAQAFQMFVTRKSDGGDVNITLRNTAAGGSTDETVSIIGQTTSSNFEMSKIVFGRIGNYDPSKSSFIDFYTTRASTNMLALRIDEGQDLLLQASMVIKDNEASFYGTASDSLVKYDGSDLILDPDRVGSGSVLIGLTGNDDLEANRIDFKFSNMPTTVNNSFGTIRQNNDPFIHTFGTSNVFMGRTAGNFVLTSAASNVGIGRDALKSLTTGGANVVIGSLAGDEITSGFNNFALGSFSLTRVTTGGRNICIGTSCGEDFVTGSRNTGIGYIAFLQSTGNDNVAIGHGAAERQVKGDKNVFIGVGAGRGATLHDKNRNVFIGYNAGLNSFENDTLIIHNTASAIPLIHGNFLNRWITINGDLNVTGDVNVTGNITSANVFIPQYIFPHTNETISVIGIGTWTNITFGQEETAIKFGITHTHDDVTNATFTFTEDGLYEITYNLDLQDTSVSASDIDTASRVVYINETEILGSLFETDITKQNVEIELSHTFFARFFDGDIIVLQFTASDTDVEVSTHSNFGDHPDSATLTINKIANLL